jgi:uncharacterized protein (DUF1800 family)
MRPAERALHLLNRLAFGPRPRDVARLLEESPERYVERQLEVRSPADEAPVRDRLAGLPAIEFGINQIVKQHVSQNFSRVPVDGALAELRCAKIVRAVHADLQLREVLADFWYNHFNVYSDAWGPATPAYEREAIRPHALGKFRAILGAVATHPGMLFFLDSFLNTADRMVDGKLVRGLNENFGRELLELHTVGVDAGYTQEDVIGAARTLTGWDFGGWQADPYRFTFQADKHDTDEKKVFGLALGAGAGQDEGERLLDYLASHPATAQFISRRLVQRFVADEPPASLVKRCAKVFLDSAGDTRSLVRTIVGSDEFWSRGVVGAKLKTPFEYTVSALRAVDAVVEDATDVAKALGDMGMPLYDCLPPTGYSNNSKEWLGAASQVRRFDFAFKLAAGRVTGVKTNPNSRASSGGSARSIARSLSEDVLAGRLSPRTLAVVSGVRASPSVDVRTKVTGLVLASPEFQMR